MPGVIVDIGTGDGKFALELAKQHLDRYIIGIDPNHQGLVQSSRSSEAGNHKDKLPNLLYVLASIEDLPPELDGLANQVFINFPWAGLMQGLLKSDPTTWQSLGRICQPGAMIEIVFSHDADRDRKLGLAQIDSVYVSDTLRLALAPLGFDVAKFDELSAEDLKNYPSSWAKRLAHGQARQFYHLQVRKR